MDECHDINVEISEWWWQTVFTSTESTCVLNRVFYCTQRVIRIVSFRRLGRIVVTRPVVRISNELCTDKRTTCS